IIISGKQCFVISRSRQKLSRYLGKTNEINSKKRSVVWDFFETVDSGTVHCLLCSDYMIRYEQGSTTNMLRHLRAKHPVFSQLVKRTVSGKCFMDLETKPVAFCLTGVLKVSRASEGEKRLFRREQELIESMRRAQREEARALEHQRELLEKLRAANAREAAAEREQIESLRKAQQEEAKDLNRQKDELQKEKAELQKKWEELQREREDLLLFTSEQQVDSVTT
uniref:BED-type domain-containing protein n=1 Tax=Sparus aurata TaxID=8175 RepID=A0A671U9P1_SPAAU